MRRKALRDILWLSRNNVTDCLAVSFLWWLTNFLTLASVSMPGVSGLPVSPDGLGDDRPDDLPMDGVLRWSFRS